MHVTSFAREKWNGGIRDAEEMAAAFVEEALRSEDATELLRQAVLGTFSEECRRLRKSLADSAPMWDAPVRSPRRPETAAITRVFSAATDKRAQLLREQVNTATRGLILWQDITPEDIEITVAVYRHQITGVEHAIKRLESARRVMEQHGVERLGDAPWEEIAGIIRAA